MSKKMSCMTSDLMSANSLGHAGEQLQQYTMFLHAEKIWVCVRKDFVHTEPWKEETKQAGTVQMGVKHFADAGTAL